jgi:hypothetical protein
MPVARAARELDRAKQQAQRQAAREERERAARIKRARQAESGRAEIAARSLGEGGGRPRPASRIVSKREVLQAVADGMNVRDGLEALEHYGVYSQLIAWSPAGHKLGRPRTEWVKDDEHRYYRPYTRDELLAQAEQLGIVFSVSQI